MRLEALHTYGPVTPELVESLQARSDAADAELMEAIRVHQLHFPPLDLARLRKQAEDLRVAHC